MSLKKYLKNLDYNIEGVDVYFTKKAIGDEKARLYLETVDEQLGFIKNMGDGNENEFVLYSLQDIEDNNKDFTDLIDEWKAGKTDLISSELQEFRDDYPEIYQTLLVQRNTNWMTHLADYLETPEVEFVVVGAMHLFGDDGILQLLKEKGYKVKQL